MRDNSYSEEAHPALAAFQSLAREAAVWVLVGSLTVKVRDAMMANRSYLLAADGAIVARYDKIHMFDATLPGGKVIRESSAYRAGGRAVLAATPWGGLGMSVFTTCAFRACTGPWRRRVRSFWRDPSSFQRETGVAHWHTLLRARAIENLSYVFAPAMCGEHPGHRSTFGQTL